MAGSRSRRRRRTPGTSATLAGAGPSGTRSSGGTSGTRTGGGTRTAPSRGARAAPGRSGRRGRRLAGGVTGTAAGRMCPPGEAEPGSPTPGTGSGALAETPAAAETCVSVWGEGGPEPALTCSRLPGCHGWTIPLGAPSCLSSRPGPGQGFVLRPGRVSGGGGWEQQDAPLNPWGGVSLLHWGQRLLGVLSALMGQVWAPCPPGMSCVPRWICRAALLCQGD